MKKFWYDKKQSSEYYEGKIGLSDTTFSSCTLSLNLSRGLEKDKKR